MSAPTDDEAVKKSVEILDYSTVVEKLADRQKLSEVKVRAVVRGLVALVADGLKSGKAVRIGGLGVLRVRDMEARAALTVGGKSHKASKRVVLSSAKKFNIAVNLE